ncbi:MAG: trypsin-like peptidase domain-containing protein [Clostridia bacterium]|nr:trypsin-like peptidase domain-containing protein [Clostridia bacterium]
MSDNFENKNEQIRENIPVEPVAAEPVSAESVSEESTPVEPTPADKEPVNGAYHYRTYDLKARQGEEEPQATFGNAGWQWQPAQPVEEEAPKKRRKIKWGKVILSAVGVVLAAAICFTAGYAGVLVANQKNTVIIQQVTPAPVTEQSGSAAAPQPVITGALTSAQVAAKVESSVVAITTEHMTTSNYWFGNYVTSGAGSGVIISQDGYILTCAHVIDGASKITVELQGGETAVATLVGSYTNGDIAVIKIDKTGLTAAEIADSDKILQGEACYAVGNPEGRFSGSISDGIVSALDRTITVQVESAAPNGGRGNSLYDMFYGGGTYVQNIQLNVLQMTAAVSPGNSGGALFNDRGQLIGIVSAKSSQTDSEGLGFAIPSNNAMEIASQLIATGTYVPQGSQQQADPNSPTPTANKAILGITVQTLDAQTAYQYGMMPGVYVSDITVQSTKDAGLQVGDRIISVDDIAVSQATDVTGYLANKNPGDTVTLTVARENKMLTLTIPLVANEGQ